ncbi:MULTISPECIES: GntR family transcriptional regulator [unclassified Streptomyces]|uniref:GntR family transcriptional regulator n=1 Tax=unclassified Streptomyces TaxID=2593676 RepID=UPI0036E4F34B
MPVAIPHSFGRELKYRKLADDLRRRIQNGHWLPGAKLPTEAELAAGTGMSVNTVRRAYEELATEHLVVRRQGAGTFVSDRPTPPARAHRVVGLLIPEDKLYFAPIVQGVEAAASASDSRVIVRTTGYGPAGEREAARGIKSLLADGVDGLLLTLPGPDIHRPAIQLARELGELPVPTVYLERRLASAGAADRTEHVYTDHAGGTYDAIRHLHALGHRRIALVCRSGATPTRGVIDGYTQAAADLEIYAPDPIIWDSSYGLFEQHTQQRQFTARATMQAICDAEASAVLCFGDPESIMLLAAAQRAHLRVPEDLALVSYDDRLVTEADVPLTAVVPEKYRMGRIAVDMLLRRLSDPEAELRQVRLRPRLAVRASCGANSLPLPKPR